MTGAWTWRHVPSIGSAPLPRFGAAVAMWGPQLVVFGGNSATGLLNDVWTLDIDEKEVPPLSLHLRAYSAGC